MKTIYIFAAMGALIMTFLLLFTACSTTAPQTSTDTAMTKSDLSGGAKLWSQNCGHCHNIRSPDSYSVAQWEVVMLHMRVRANLTAQEHKAILAFLQSVH